MMEMNEMTDVLVAVRADAIFVTLNDPEHRNALSDSMLGSIERICTHVMAKQGHYRGLVIRGAGGVFSAGGNIKTFNIEYQSVNTAAESIAEANRRYGALLNTLDSLPLPVVAAVDGAAVGGGVGLAAIADVVIATAASTFSLTETTLGLPPAQIAPFVAARVGRHTSRRLMLTAARLNASAAASVGLVDEVVDDCSALDAAVDKTMERVRRCAPRANAITKGLVNASARMPLGDLLDHSAEQFAASMTAPEAKEGIAAFLERRQPPWATCPGADSGHALPAPSEARNVNRSAEPNA
jgi:isohexenylglutaconyl-CoA hydratase